MNQDLITKTEAFVFNLFKDKLHKAYIYHNFTHTKRVFKSTLEIIKNSKVNVNDGEIVLLAALLHDTGYTICNDGHEEESVKIATKFLTDQKVNKEKIDAINKCIMATKFKDSPKSHLEKILRDADASHFGKKYFNEASEFLRKELEILDIKKYSPKQWLNENIKVLSEQHTYHTEYALRNWQKRKEKNLGSLINDKKKRKEKINTEEIKAKYKAQYKNESPDRGIQSFFRTTLKNHIKLSDIADTKANILLSVNAIIISVVLANLISKLDTNPYLTMPTVVFTLFSVISMVLSIIATRPNVTRGEFNKEDVKNKKVNLAFFGNFHKMSLPDYEWAINELLKDKEYIYSSLTKDLYFLGQVLNRKYKILRITYTVFMIGIIVSLFAFAYAIKTNPAGKTEKVIKAETIERTITKPE